MWTHEESIETTASPLRIWALFSDVAGWKAWNAGIESIEVHGPFARGTRFSMRPPGQDAFESTLIDVSENQGFTDETVIDGTRVVVYHRIESLAPGRTKVTYSTEITGPGAQEFGPLVTADFPDVLRSLKALAETGT
jgi:hypothetical protein